MDNLKENGFDSVYMMINSQDFSNSMWYPFISENYEYALLENDPITDSINSYEQKEKAENSKRNSLPSENHTPSNANAPLPTVLMPQVILFSFLP